MVEARRRASAMISKAVGMRSRVVWGETAAAAAAGHGEEVCVRRRAAQPPPLLATKLRAGRAAALYAAGPLRSSSIDDAVVSSIWVSRFCWGEREQLVVIRFANVAEPKEVV
jgi:hypothetical protein